MRKLLFFLALVPLMATGQTLLKLPYKTVAQNYKGDSLITTIEPSQVKVHTNNTFFLYTKSIVAPSVEADDFYGDFNGIFNGVINSSLGTPYTNQHKIIFDQDSFNLKNTANSGIIQGFTFDNNGARYRSHRSTGNPLWIPDKFYTDSLVSASGGFAPQSGLLKWVTNKYVAYTDSTGTGSYGGIYKGTQDPTTTTRYNFNGMFQPTQLAIKNSSFLNGLTINNTGAAHGAFLTNTSTGAALLIENSGSGFGAYVRNTTVGNGVQVRNESAGKGYVVNNLSSGKGISIDNSSTGTGIDIVNANNTSVGIGIKIKSYIDNYTNLVVTDYQDSARLVVKTDTLAFGDIPRGNYVQVSAENAIKLLGTSTVWEDDNLDPTTLTGAGTAPTATQWASTGISIAGFANNTTDEVAGTREIPHKTKLGSNIYFHAHWAANTTNVGNVRYGLEYFFTTEGVATTTSTTIYLTASTTGTAWAKISSEFPPITIPNEIGAQFHFRFFRLGSDALDTYTGVAAVSTIGYHYEIDSMGSKDVTVK
jgi:hypothetical protein